MLLWPKAGRENELFAGKLMLNLMLLLMPNSSTCCLHNEPNAIKGK